MKNNIIIILLVLLVVGVGCKSDSEKRAEREAREARIEAQYKFSSGELVEHVISGVSENPMACLGDE